MTPARAPTALIAEDEPLLAAALKAELAGAWPELNVLAVVGDGASAVRMALEHQPDVLFFDIRMPGLSGLEAAAELADGWATPASGGQPFPALVFVTAYDQYAVQAFEAQAVDYLLKPVQVTRLLKTVARLRSVLAERSSPQASTPASEVRPDAAFDRTMAQLRQLLAMSPPSGAMNAAPLKLIQVSVGTTIRIVPTEEVVYFEAADKYVRVLTRDHEYLIRTPLRELLPQLDTQQFWQIHRATVVRTQAVEAVTRDEAGKAWLQLRGRSEKLAVSRLYAHLFKAM
jgi:DNA-binding LytR/AlgR family response regulator